VTYGARMFSSRMRRAGGEQLLRRNVKRFRGGLVFKAHRLFVSLNSRLESNEEEEEGQEESGRETGGVWVGNSVGNSDGEGNSDVW